MPSMLVWAMAALGAGIVVLWLGARAVMPGRAGGPVEEPLPSTALQRASWWSLGLSLLFALAAAVVVASAGAERAMGGGGFRVVVSLLAVASLAAAGTGAWRVIRRARRGGEVLDERDRAILERAPAVQSLATILALSVWTVVLTERFWSAHDVPLFFLHLVFWSCLLVNLLGLPVGVLMGYRRM